MLRHNPCIVVCNSDIAEIATGASKRCICVSTLREAEVFAGDGYDDILFAAHFGPDKIERYVKLPNIFISSLCVSIFKGHSPGGPGFAGTVMSPFWILLELRVMEVVVIIGAIRCANL